MWRFFFCFLFLRKSRRLLVLGLICVYSGHVATLYGCRCIEDTLTSKAYPRTQRSMHLGHALYQLLHINTCMSFLETTLETLEPHRLAWHTNRGRVPFSGPPFQMDSSTCHDIFTCCDSDTSAALMDNHHGVSIGHSCSIQTLGSCGKKKKKKRSIHPGHMRNAFQNGPANSSAFRSEVSPAARHQGRFPPSSVHLRECVSVVQHEKYRRACHLMKLHAGGDSGECRRLLRNKSR